MCLCRFIKCNNVLSAGDVDGGETVPVVGGQGACAKSLALLLNFAVNLKLL